MVSNPWLCVEFQGGLTVAEGASGAGAGMDDGFCQPAGGPFEIDLEAASGKKAGDYAVRPGGRKRRQQMKSAILAVNQWLLSVAALASSWDAPVTLNAKTSGKFPGINR